MKLQSTFTLNKSTANYSNVSLYSIILLLLRLYTRGKKFDCCLFFKYVQFNILIEIIMLGMRGILFKI